MNWIHLPDYCNLEPFISLNLETYISYETLDDKNISFILLEGMLDDQCI